MRKQQQMYLSRKNKKTPVEKYVSKMKDIPYQTYKTTLDIKKSKNQLYNEAVRKIGLTNKRIKSISREFGGDIGWAGNILKNRTERNLVNTWKARGGKGIKINKNMSEEQLQATINSIDRFLKSQTSSIKGIKNVMKKQQDTLRRTFSRPDYEISKEESKTLYELFDDPNFRYATDIENINASTMFTLMVEAKAENWKEQKFQKQLENIMTHTPDENMREKIKAIFDKWM